MNDLGGVLTGNKAIQIEARLNNGDLQKASLYLFGAFFLAVLLANFITKK